MFKSEPNSESQRLLPIITLKWAQTLDGQLADDQDQSQWISGQEERKYTHALRSRHEAVLVGAQTFLKDRCQLTVRDIGYEGPQPARVVMDPRGRSLRAILQDPSLIEFLQSGPRKTYLLTDVIEDEDLKASLRHPNLVLLSYRFSDFKNWLKGSLLQLAISFERHEERRLNGLMVEGGAATLAAFLSAGLAHHLEVAISPLILGGQKHHVSTGKLLANVDRFEMQSQERLGADILLRYRVL